jgi:hypothetical protein
LSDGILRRAETIADMAERDSSRYDSRGALHLVAEHARTAFLANDVAFTRYDPGVIAKPLAEEAIQLKAHLALRADETSRMVNEFPRVFLQKFHESNATMQLKPPIFN